MAPRARVREVEPANVDGRNEPVCEQAQATDRNTAAIERLVEEVISSRADFRAVVEAAVKELAPAAHAIAELGEAQRKLCSFLVKNRLKLTGGVIGALIAVGAISEPVGARIGALLAGLPL